MCVTTATNIPSCPDKKTLVLFGAPRTDGATGTLADLFLSDTAGAVTMIDCFAQNVAPCDDCRGCHRTIGCVKHDMDEIYGAIEQADTLVFITPVYNRSFPAPMKAIIDRLQCYWAARFVHGKKPPIEKPKTAILLTVCGSDRDDGNCVEEQLAPALTVLNVTAFSSLHVKNTDRTVDWQEIANRLDMMNI